jgi:uncharacterized linocin/CFP29 family protein
MKQPISNSKYKMFVNESNANLSSNQDLPQGFNVLAARPFIGKDGQTYVLNEQGKQIKTNAPSPLRYEEWLDIDETAVQSSTDNLVVFGDVLNMGLIHSLGSVGQTVSLWDKESDTTGADINMSGATESEKDSLNFDQDQVPVPVVSKGFNINWRTLEASRKMGEALDTASIRVASRKVSEASEDMLLNGVSSITVKSSQIYGYLNHPNRNQVAMGTAWTAVTDNQDIIDEMNAALDALRADNFTGSFMVYVPLGYVSKLDEDFKVGTGDTRTLRQRILELSNVAGIKPVKRLTGNNVILVQLTNDVVDIAVAQGIVPLQWSIDGGMTSQNKVLAVWAPRLKDDYDGRMGLAVIAL